MNISFIPGFNIWRVTFQRGSQNFTKAFMSYSSAYKWVERMKENEDKLTYKWLKAYYEGKTNLGKIYE